MSDFVYYLCLTNIKNRLKHVTIGKKYGSTQMNIWLYPFQFKTGLSLVRFRAHALHSTTVPVVNLT